MACSLLEVGLGWADIDHWTYWFCMIGCTLTVGYSCVKCCVGGACPKDCIYCTGCCWITVGAPAYVTVVVAPSGTCTGTYAVVVRMIGVWVTTWII